MTALANPALADLEVLVGRWEVTLSQASFLADPEETATLRAVFEPIESGRLLSLRQLSEGSGPPLASWVMGRDGTEGDYTVLYADDRVVSRVYAMQFVGRTWRMWRDDPEFAQRFEARLDADGREMTGRWERREAGGGWEHDFTLTYRRID
jgi:hypothetical protein